METPKIRFGAWTVVVLCFFLTVVVHKTHGLAPYWASDPTFATFGLKWIFVDEHSPVGTVLWTADAVDPEGTSIDYAYTWWTVAVGIAQAPNGDLVVTSSADYNYEAFGFAGPQMLAVVSATDQALETTSPSDMWLLITVNDIAEAPEFTNLPDNTSLPETHVAGQDLITVLATDEDAGDTATFTGMTVSPTGGPFSFNTATGVISVDANPGLRYAATSMYVLTVTATDGSLTSNENYTVYITPVPLPPTLDNLPNTTDVLETESPGYTVFEVLASDYNWDTLTYILVTAGTPFQINDTTGVLKLVSFLDYETTNSYTLDINITDGVFMVGSETLTITVLDVNEAPDVTNLPAETVLLDSQILQETIYSVQVNDPEGDSITYSLGTVPAGGPFAIDAQGNISVNSNPNLDGTVIDQYTLNVGVDDGSHFQLTTLIVNITIVNDPPDFTNLPDTVTIAENTLGAATVFTVSSTDPEADVITYSMTSLQAPSPFTINSATGAISHGASPNFDYESIPYYNLTITATDGQNSSESSLDVDILDVNETPVITSTLVYVTVNESETAQRDLLTVAASDEDGDVIVFSVLASYPTTASFLVNPATGVLCIISNPGLDYESVTSYVLTVEASDGSLTDTQNVTIDVLDVNEAPTLDNLPDTVTVSEDEMLSRVIHITGFSDVDAGDTLTVSIDYSIPPGAPFVCDSPSGNISLNNNPGLDFESIPLYVLAIVVTDAGGLSATANLTVNVTDVNETPTISNLPNGTTITEDTTGVISIYDVIASDPDGDVITFSLTSTPTAAPFTLSATGLIETIAAPNLDFETTTSYTLHIEVSDGVLSYSSDYVVNIGDVNETPVVSQVTPQAVVMESETVSRLVYSVNASDEDLGDSLTYAIDIMIPGGAPFSCDPTSGNITLDALPNLDFETTSEYQLNISVTDSGGLTVTLLLTVNVTDVNEIPVIANLPDNISLTEHATGVLSVFNVSASDPDGDVLIFTLTSTPAAAPFTLSATGEIETTAVPNFDYETTSAYTLHVQASDGFLSVSADLLVNITDLNEPPVFDNATVEEVVLESETTTRIVHTMGASDQDIGDTLTYSINATTPLSAPFTCDPSTGAISLINSPGLDFETVAQYTLLIMVVDSGGLSDISTLTVNVTDVNEIPVIANLPDNISSTEHATGVLSVFNVSASDPDGDVLIFTLTSTPAAAPFTVSANGEIETTAVPNFDYETTSAYTLHVQASDGFLSVSADLLVNITDLNEPPVFDNATVEEVVVESETTSRIVYIMGALDQDIGDTLIYSINATTPLAAPFTCDPSTGAISLINSPGLDFETVTQYTLLIMVVDSGGLSDVSTLTVNVTDVNETPVITNLPNTPGTLRLYENHTGVVSLFLVNATDGDGDGLLFSFTSTPTGAPFTISATGEVSTVASPNFDYGTTTVYTLHVNVSDGSLDDVQDLTINIDDINYDIVMYNLPDAMSVGELMTGVIFTVNATDPDGLTLSYAISVLPVTGTSLFSVDAAGDISVVSPPGLDFETTAFYQIDVTATGTDGFNNTERLDLTILDDPEPPTVINLPDTVSVLENVTFGITIFTVNASDPEDDVITYSMTSSPNDGKFTISDTTGDVGYVDNPSFQYQSTASYTLTVYANDGSNTSPGDVLSVNIVAVNELPSISNLPASISLSETVQNEAGIFQVLATDSDGGDNVTYSFVVSPSSGNAKFFVTSSGEIYIVSRPDFDYETEDQYLIDVTVTDDETGNSVMATLSVNIQDENEAPSFNATGIAVDIDEEVETTYPIPAYITATDPDNGDHISYYLDTPNAYNDYFAIALLPEPELRVADRLDYDDLTFPRTITIRVIAQDSSGLQDSVAVKISLQNINDNTPLFPSNLYRVTILRNLPAGTKVALVEARDADLGTYGRLSYSLLGVFGNRYFRIDSTGLITIGQSIDIETINYIPFLVVVKDGGRPPRTNNVSVEVMITDQNDNRPKFLQEFYNFQVRDDANTSAFVGIIEAVDIDEDDYSWPMNYKLTVQTTLFTLGLNSGTLRTETQQQADWKYVLYAVAQDNDIPQDTSEVGIVRVDTYTAAEVLMDFTIAKDPSSFASPSAGISEFLAVLQVAIQKKLAEAAVRLVYINDQEAALRGLVNSDIASIGGSSTTFTVVILKSNITDLADNLDQPKEYYTVSKVMSKISVKYLEALGPDFPVTEVEPHIPQKKKKCNWWLCTIPGNATIAGICLSFLSLTAGGIYLAVKNCKNGKGFSPKPTEVRPQPKRKRSSFDFRYGPHGTATGPPVRPATTDQVPASWRETDSPLSAPVYTSHGGSPTMDSLDTNFTQQGSLPDVDESIGYHSSSPSPMMSNRSELTPGQIALGFTPNSSAPLSTAMRVRRN